MELEEIDRIPLISFAMKCEEENVVMICKFLTRNQIVFQYFNDVLSIDEGKNIYEELFLDIKKILKIKENRKDLTKFIKSFSYEENGVSEIYIFKLAAIGYKNPEEGSEDTIVKYHIDVNRNQLIELKEFYQYKILVDYIKENNEKILRLAELLYEAVEMCYEDNKDKLEDNNKVTV